LELLQKRGGGDFLKELSEAMLQRLMESGGGWRRTARAKRRPYHPSQVFPRALAGAAPGHAGAADSEAAPRQLLSSFPGAAQDGRASIRRIVQEAWIQGVSTRKVDDLVQAMGISGISKSQVSELCQEIDERAAHRGCPSTASG
jgi:putative transposase